MPRPAPDREPLALDRYRLPGPLTRLEAQGVAVFHRGAVQALSSTDSVTPRLASLVRKELIQPAPPPLPGEDGFRFRHLLIRDAAYEALPKATRIELHRRFADWLEERGRDLIELDEIAGYHLEQACRYRAELGMPHDERLATAARSSRLAAAVWSARSSARRPAAARRCRAAVARRSSWGIPSSAR